MISFEGRNASYDINTFTGGVGNDRLEGWTGSDTYVFNRGDGHDVINDYDYGSYRYSSGYATTTRHSSFNKTDKLVFGADVSAEQLWFSREDNHLSVGIIGSEDQVTLENWYSDTMYHIEEIVLADGSTLHNEDVEKLVSAMAALTPPAQGELNLSDELHQELETLIAANWS